MTDLSLASNPFSLPELWTMIDRLGQALAQQRAAQAPARLEIWQRMMADLEQQLSQVRLELAALEQQLQGHVRYHDQLRALQRIGVVIGSSLDLDDVLAAVMDSIVSLLGAERGLLLLINEESGRLEVRVARGLNRQAVAAPTFGISRSIVDQVFRGGEAIITANVAADPQLEASESIISRRLRAVACVPLRIGDQALGVIYADNQAVAPAFLDADRGLLGAFAGQAASVIENARLFAQTRRQLAAITEMNYLMEDVFASIPSGVVTINGDDTIALCNRAAAALFGRRPEQAMLGSYRELMPGIGGVVGALLEQVRHAGTPRYAEVDTTTPDDGLRRTLGLHVSPLRDAHGELRGFTLVLEDISEQKRLESVRRYLPPVLVDRARDLDAAQQPQRQRLSVLFADVRGFTALSEALPPERLIAVINGYFTVATRAISSYGGIIDKFMGDAVMALFNTPLNPQADHAARAVGAAAAIQRGVLAYHAEMPAALRLHFGIGLHTGEAVVGNLGSRLRKDYSAIGDGVNLARRIEELAEPGQVLLTQAVLDALPGDPLAVQALAPVEVRGRRQAPRLYALEWWRGAPPHATP